METRIIVESDSTKVRIGGPAIGSIWLEIGGRQFPSRGWNDFVVVVLSWWATAIQRVLHDPNERVIVHFMEGPYAVEVWLASPDVLRLRALEGPRRSPGEVVGAASPMEFALELVVQARHVLTACRAQHWWSADAASLESSLLELERIFAKSKQQ